MGHYAGRFARRKDSNHSAIVDALHSLGCSVLVNETAKKGAPDLVVAKNGCTALAEVKPDSTIKAQRELREDQQLFFSAWKGLIVVLRTIEDCQKLVALLQAIGEKQK